MEDEEYVVRNLPEPKGLFGIRGNARNILGTIGDAFLMQAGRDPIYRQRVQDEKIARAIFDMQEDPDRAIERLASTPGAAPLALKFQDNLADQRRMQAIADRENRINLAKEEDRTNEVLSRYAGILTKENWAPMRERMSAFAKRRGSPFDMPEVFDPRWIVNFRAGGIPTKDQVRAEDMEEYRDARLGQFDRGLGIRERATDSLIDYRGSQVGLGRDRLEETERHNRVTENKPSGRGGGGGSGGSSTGFRPPAKKQDQLKGSNGVILGSSDGKNWDYVKHPGQPWKKR